MADSPKGTDKARREQRLQAALRENLKRRKVQARGRAERAETDSQSEERPLAITAEKQRTE
jgi:hypothetical protein